MPKPIEADEDGQEQDEKGTGHVFGAVAVQGCTGAQVHRCCAQVQRCTSASGHGPHEGVDEMKSEAVGVLAELGDGGRLPVVGARERTDVVERG